MSLDEGDAPAEHPPPTGPAGRPVIPLIILGLSLLLGLPCGLATLLWPPGEGWEGLVVIRELGGLILGLSAAAAVTGVVALSRPPEA